MSELFSWISDLFGGNGASANYIELVLRPDASGRTWIGFGSGADLKLSGLAGETVGIFMDRFNSYRGPGQQIAELRREDGTPLPFSTVLNGSMIAVVFKNKTPRNE